jgi:flagellar motor switch protein FliM
MTTTQSSPGRTARRQLSQAEINRLFPGGAAPPPEPAKAEKYDFMRPDRIPQSQLRTIRILHENLARSLGSTFSAYFRSPVTVTVSSFEQLSYGEFIRDLSSPTVAAALSLRPYESRGVIELGPAAFFPMLEMLLGGSGKTPARILHREITEIEQKLLEMLLRVMTQELREAWKSLAPIEFTLQAIEKEPQTLQVLAPSEAVIAVGLEISVGRHSGPLNIAIPSVVIKMVRHKFEQQWILRSGEMPAGEQAKMMRLIEKAALDVEVSLEGARIRMGDLANLKPGELVIFDIPAGRPAQCLVNGRPQLTGQMARKSGRLVFVADPAAEGAPA